MDFIAARYFVYCGICTSSTVGWLYCKFYEFYFVSYYFKIFKYYIYLVHNCYFVYGIIVLCYNNKHKDHFLNSNFIFSVLVETHSTLQTGKAHLEKKNITQTFLYNLILQSWNENMTLGVNNKITINFFSISLKLAFKFNKI